MTFCLGGLENSIKGGDLELESSIWDGQELPLLLGQAWTLQRSED